MFITTKCPGIIGYEATIQCVDDNMQMLNLLTDQGEAVNGYIDLLLIHFPYKTPLECRFRDLSTCSDDPDVLRDLRYTTLTKDDFQSTWKALEDLKKLGVLKSIGVSSYSVEQLEWTREIATEPIDVNQVNWNPLVHDDALLQYCKSHGITLQAWSPLGASDGYQKIMGKPGSLFSDSRIDKIAKNHGVTPPQVILRWSLQQGVAITTSSNNPAHQKSDFGLWDFELTASEMATISNISSSTLEAQSSAVLGTTGPKHVTIYQ